jgi:hypothetical protein
LWVEERYSERTDRAEVTLTKVEIRGETEDPFIQFLETSIDETVGSKK